MALIERVVFVHFLGVPYHAGVPLGLMPLGRVRSAISNIAAATPIGTAQAVMVVLLSEEADGRRRPSGRSAHDTSVTATRMAG